MHLLSCLIFSSYRSTAQAAKDRSQADSGQQTVVIQAPLTRWATYQSFIFIVLRVSLQKLVRSVGFIITGLRFQAQRSQVTLLGNQASIKLNQILLGQLLLRLYQELGLLQFSFFSIRKDLVCQEQGIVYLEPNNTKAINQVYRRQGLQVNYSILSLLTWYQQYVLN